jgi:hypothetical protein
MPNLLETITFRRLIDAIETHRNRDTRWSLHDSSRRALGSHCLIGRYYLEFASPLTRANESGTSAATEQSVQATLSRRGNASRGSEIVNPTAAFLHAATPSCSNLQNGLNNASE